MHPELLRKQGNGMGFTRQTRRASVSFLTAGFPERRGTVWACTVQARRAPVPREHLLFDSRIQSTVAIHFQLGRQLGWQKCLQSVPASV